MSRRHRLPRWGLLGAGLIVGLALAVLVIRLVVNTPPSPPLIIDPRAAEESLDALRLELAPFHDPDGDGHQATDWEIRSPADSDAVVWASYGSTEAVHVALADGVFQGPQAAVQRLNFQKPYLLRVRVQDRRGVWSAWVERPFVSPVSPQVAPRRVRGILPRPAPRWRTEGDAPLVLPAGAQLTAEAAGGAVWLTLSGAGQGLSVAPGPIFDHPEALRLRLVAPAGAPLSVPASRLELIAAWADRAERLTIALPAVRLVAGQQQAFWVSEMGATFYAAPAATAFSREVIARDVPAPYQLLDGYRAEVVTAALQLPTSLAFVANPGADPGAPRFYVTELYGRIKVVTNDGRVLPFAERLLNLNPSGVFPGSGENGVTGICLPPTGRDVYATMLYRDQAGSLRNKIVRLRSRDGLVVDQAEEIFASRPGTGLARAAHQIQQCSFGPDGKLYVAIGDGTEPANALSPRSFGGKLLRFNPDGSAPTDNPFYDPAQPAAPISFVYLQGLRNAFSHTWRADGQLYLSDNGPNVDRLIRAERGASYGWNGTDESMRTGALYTWPESRWAPVGLTFVEGPGAAMLAHDQQDSLLVGSSGLVYAKGTRHAGKAIQAFTLDPDGRITRPPTLFARYLGEGQGTIIDLKLQPDGLYYTSLFRDDGDGGATAPGGQVWRVRYVGATAFTASVKWGRAPLEVAFRTTATPRDGGACAWDFGDGQAGDTANPTHTFAQAGFYAVSLTCADAAGGSSERLGLVTVVGDDWRAPAPAAVPVVAPGSPAAEAVTFRETGVRLEGAFLRFWEANGGLAIFGHPLTPVVRERLEDGREYQVQVFERAQFEALVSAPDRIELAPLGRQATARRAGEPPFRPLEGGALAATPERLVFPETGHTLSGPFRTRWEATGGATIHGLPISEPFEEKSLTDGKSYLVQYFERARFEWHPEAAGRLDEIRLARLGAAQVVTRPAAESPPRP